jgi:hypothetical protein
MARGPQSREGCYCKRAGCINVRMRVAVRPISPYTRQRNLQAFAESDTPHASRSRIRAQAGHPAPPDPRNELDQPRRASDRGGLGARNRRRRLRAGHHVWRHVRRAERTLADLPCTCRLAPGRRGRISARGGCGSLSTRRDRGHSGDRAVHTRCDGQQPAEAHGPLGAKRAKCAASLVVVVLLPPVVATSRRPLDAPGYRRGSRSQSPTEPSSARTARRPAFVPRQAVRHGGQEEVRVSGL